MKTRAILIILLCGICAYGLSSTRARASEIIYDGAGLLMGQQSFEDSFSVSTAGTLTVTLTNVPWPESLANLNFVVGTSQGLLGPEMGAGTASFEVEAGNIYAQWFGTAQGPLDAGSYSLNIQFTPSVVAPVPLPNSILLLFSGLALLAWQRRYWRSSARSVLPA
jgi:hypothetical protein